MQFATASYNLFLFYYIIKRNNTCFELFIKFCNNDID